MCAWLISHGHKVFRYRRLEAYRLLGGEIGREAAQEVRQAVNVQLASENNGSLIVSLWKRMRLNVRL